MIDGIADNIPPKERLVKDALLRNALVLVLLLSFFLSGCAAILKGSRQEVYLNSDPRDARIEVGQIVTNAPTSLMLERDSDHYVTFSKEGYEPQTLEIISRRSWFWTATDIVVWGFIFGWVVDESVGGNYYLEPSQLMVRLKEKPLLPPPNISKTPASQTINEKKLPEPLDKDIFNDDFFKKGFDSDFIKNK